jgi:hypothetical protein
MQITTNLLHSRSLFGRDAKRVEAQRDHERHSAVVVVAVMIHETS